VSAARAGTWRLTLRQALRDLAAGEVRLLIAALALAVASVTTISFLTDRAERALALEANRLLGGDAVLRADAPLSAAMLAKAERPGLRAVQTVEFPSMLRVGNHLRLGELRAVGRDFPLRGSFVIRDEQGQRERQHDQERQRIDHQLAGARDKKGQAQLGEQAIRIKAETLEQALQAEGFDRDAVLAELAPIRERAAEFEDDHDTVEAIVQRGADSAREVARETLEDVRASMGLEYR